MDILDIDKELKDDSFIFFEEKTHDDVSNILQQWKKNNLPFGIQPQECKDKVYPLNSKTFTRPKRKSALQQNPEKHYLNISNTINSAIVAIPTLDMEIGGLVTNAPNLRLQDTSPPTSICSSIEMSIEQMNNSLITSADFTNINFLHSTYGVELDKLALFVQENGSNDDYTLNDLIRDRKSLELLTNSADGTLIKDTQIAQIDEISMLFSKTNSSNSTMDNSTDSVIVSECNVPSVPFIEDMIMDTSMHLIDASMYGSTPLFKRNTETKEQKINANASALHISLDDPNTVRGQADETFRVPLPANCNKTIDCSVTPRNATFECTDRCETPENLASTTPILIESTPLPASLRCDANAQISRDDSLAEFNSSPILPSGRSQLFAGMHNLNETFDQYQNSVVDPIEDIISPAAVNNTFNMTKIMSVTQKIETLNTEMNDTSNRDEDLDFERILEQSSKLELTTSQIKMKRSLDSIKKRFNCSNVNRQIEEQLNALEEANLPIESSINEPLYLNKSTEIGNIANNLSSSGNSSTSMLSSSGNGGERLLGRRSRLYDNINLSMLSLPSKRDSLNSEGSTLNSTVVLANTEAADTNADTVVQVSNEKTTPTPNSRYLNRREQDSDRFKTVRIIKLPSNNTEPTNNETLNVLPVCNGDDVNQPLPETLHPENGANANPVHRISRRDSYLTSSHESAESEMDVPTVPAVNATAAPKNFLTFKKPRTRQIPQTVWQLPDVTTVSAQEEIMESAAVTVSENTRKCIVEPRSFSRPRQMVAPKKFFIGKTISASDLDSCGAVRMDPTTTSTATLTEIHDRPNVLSIHSTITTANQHVRAGGELKSPMGVKSKSFHNLSRNVSNGIETNRKYNGSTGGLPIARSSGLRKPSVAVPERKTKQEATLRVPRPISGARIPTSVQDGAESRHNSMGVRPSSGYYSLVTVPGKNNITRAACSGEGNNRHLATDGMTTQLARPNAGVNLRPKVASNVTNTANGAAICIPPGVTKLTTGITGIPKPSTKLSSLPRPSSIVRR